MPSVTRTDPGTRGRSAEHRHGSASDAAPQPSAQARTLLWLGVGVAVVAGLFLIDWLAPALFPASLPTRAQDGLTLAISVLIESLPFVVLGVILSIAVQVWLPPGVLERWMPRRAWEQSFLLQCSCW